MLNISMLEVAKNYGIIKNYFIPEELDDWKEKFKRNTITKSMYGDDCWGIDVNCLSYLWFKKVVLAKFLKFLDPNVKLIFASYIDCFTTFPVHTDVKPIPNNKEGKQYASILIPYSIDNKKDNFKKVSTNFYNDSKELKEGIQWEENSFIWWDSTLYHSSSDYKKENIESKQYFIIHTYV